MAIDAARVRIGYYFCVDAPDERQTCNADGREWRCGQEAGFALARIIRDALDVLLRARP